MLRSLLNDYTSTELALMIVGGLVVIAVVGWTLSQRLLPSGHLRRSNDITGVILGVLAVVYGIVLAFVIVALYEEFRQAGSDVRTEATALSEVYRDSKAFTPAGAASVKTAVGDYITVVVTKEWSAMRHGKESDEAWRRLNDVYAALERYTPTTVVQQDFYREAVGRVNDLASARRARLNDAEESLPPTFDVLLVVGALLLLVTTFLFGTDNPRLHLVLAVLVAALIGFNLLLALELDYPFSGQVSVSSQPYTQGALADFKYAVPRQ